MNTVFGHSIPTSAELRFSYNDMEQRLKVKHIGSMEVNHHMAEISYCSDYLRREFLPLGTCDITLRGCTLEEVKQLTSAEWDAVNAIVAAANTHATKTFAADMQFLERRVFSANEVRAMFGLRPLPANPAVTDAEVDSMARAFYDGEERREHFAARCDEAEYEEYDY